ncbi:MAG: DNA-3-methyladenine glycosylase [Gammaproteobacteria bacterium]|nr:DNA-3-methyladenine glycosylase [Gammaproteobacteria bacterium]
MILPADFFSQNACDVAQALIGKIIRRKFNNQWLAARIIETEAYYLSDKASHSSLGYTEKRKAMFMPAGTIYMYYARGHDSLNISCGNEGDAVLIKSAFPFVDKKSPEKNIKTMQKLNPANNGSLRPLEKLCAGQTLLCKALNLKVTEWDQKQFNKNKFYIEDINITPNKIIQTTRLGIHRDRDAHLHYRFIDYEYVKYSSNNPLTKKMYKEGKEYIILS